MLAFQICRRAILSGTTTKWYQKIILELDRAQIVYLLWYHYQVVPVDFMAVFSNFSRVLV